MSLLSNQLNLCLQLIKLLYREGISVWNSRLSMGRASPGGYGETFNRCSCLEDERGKGMCIENGITKNRGMGFFVLLNLFLFAFVSSAYSQWAKTYGGGVFSDGASSIQQTTDNGYIVAGSTMSFGAGSFDAWVLKLDNSGNVQWQKAYGGTSLDSAHSVQQTTDGGYIVAGETVGDAWILKLGSLGDIQWQKTYGGTRIDYIQSVQQTTDAGYVLAGWTESFGAGAWDFWVLKLDSLGKVEWQKTYGGTESDQAQSIQQTRDGGYIVAGNTWSGVFAPVDTDIWVLKLDSSGGIEWQKKYKGLEHEQAYSIRQTTGGYIMAGKTARGLPGSSMVWILKLDIAGVVEWEKAYDGTDTDDAYSIQRTKDGGYILAGTTRSFGAGSTDIWILKLDSFGNIKWQKTYGGTRDEYSQSVQQTKDGGYIVAGHTNSFGAGGGDIWVLKLDPLGDIPRCNWVRKSDATAISTPATVVKTTIEGMKTSVKGKDSFASVTETDGRVGIVCAAAGSL